MAYTTIDNPELYFQCKIYTGTGSEIAATLDGSENMQPDLVVLKARTDSESFKVYDSVRGVTKHIEWDTTDAEATEAQGLKSFDSDGFTIGTYSSINASSSHNYVAWCWKESATAGFDIVSFTGNDTARTISHNLSAVPKMMIFKNTGSSSSEWPVYHGANTSAPATDRLFLSGTHATGDNSTFFNDTAPTSSVFSVGDSSDVNEASEVTISYLFAEKQGYSKFGSYVGNGSDSGSYIHLGFKPAFFLLKKSSATDPWVIFDNKRATFNPFDRLIYPDSSEAQSGAAERGDFLSNGVKFRSDHTYFSGSGITYIYMAFAEQPFVNSKGVPANAR